MAAPRLRPAMSGSERPEAERPPLKVDLRLFSTRAGLPGGDEKGRSYATRALWLLINAVVMRNPLLPIYSLKVAVLRAFGARIGEGVLVKPGVNVSRPWNLTIGDHCWIGERVWLDSTGPLQIGSHVVISQGAFLSCGTHDWQDPGMGSVVAPITVEDGAWIASFARIAGNVRIGQEAVVALGSVVFTDCEPRGTYRGNPAQKVGVRRIRNQPGPPRKMREAQ
jgi:putative colanic acid biosynthesis acetyltransferase WcaF